MTESGNKTQDILNAYAEGAMAERERIIKLLEQTDKLWIMESGFAENLAPVVIALIKGENKTNPWTSRPLTEEDIEHYGSIKGEK